MQNDWPLSKNQKLCSMCGERFEEERAFFSALNGERELFARNDFCRSCWENLRQKPFFSFWKTRLRARKPSPGGPKMDLHVLLDYFEELSNPETERDKAFRFVLSLLLWRRKALKLARVERGGGREVMLFHYGSAEGPVAVEIPDLSEEQIAGVADQLKELLQVDQ